VSELPGNGGSAVAIRERDIVITSDSGRRNVYKKASQREWRFPFILTPAQKDFFETQHKAVNGREQAFFFVEDIDDPDNTTYLVKKEQHFHAKEIDQPATDNDEVTTLYRYTQTLLQEPETVQIGSVALEIYECPNGTGLISNSAKANDGLEETYAELSRSHYGVFSTAKFLRVKIPFVDLAPAQTLTIESVLQYIPSATFAVGYHIDISSLELDTSGDSGDNNFWVGPIGGVINGQNTGTSPWSGTKSYVFTGVTNPMPGDVYVYFWTGTSLYEPGPIDPANILRIFEVRRTLA
jgi:hypothetical protein